MTPDATRPNEFSIVVLYAIHRTPAHEISIRCLVITEYSWELSRLLPHLVWPKRLENTYKACCWDFRKSAVPLEELRKLKRSDPWYTLTASYIHSGVNP